jgi:uncharacterized protein with PIN domain
MSTAYFDLQPELHCFLPRDKRDVTIALSFKGRQSLKHLIESLGVPHTEVGQVTVNGQARGLESVPHNGDRIEVRPAAPGCPLEPRFLLDSHLGRLAAYLRMLGFDCLYNNDYGCVVGNHYGCVVGNHYGCVVGNHYHDDGIAVILAEDPRILLTRDRRLLMRKVVQYGYCLRSLEPPEQLVEVVRRFDLAGKIAPLHRCLRCNHPLQPVSKETVLDRLEPLTKIHFDEFSLCPACDQVYWKGSHVERMGRLIESVNASSLSNHKGISYG